MKKYVVYAGKVISRRDGQEHFIRCDQLIKLYGVNPSECICVNPSDPNYYRDQGLDSLIHLYPREDGNYRNENI